MPEIVIAHDHFSIKGGGERLALILAEEMNAKLIVGYRDGASYSFDASTLRFEDLAHPLPLRNPGLRAITLAATFGRIRSRISKVPVRIFSGVSAPFAAPAANQDGVNIFYCHTPPRFLYDQKAFFTERSGPVRRLGMAVLGPPFRRGYERAVGRMDMIVANSNNIRRRIRTFLGRDSVVVYPPVDTEGFVWGEPQGYYLSTARLTPLKRIRTIVDAFRTMPDKQLVVASGGEQFDELRALAADSPNIRFTGWTDEAQLRRLVAGSIATLYVPIDEDFGMSPVESMAAGKPVIGVAEGGLLETVVPGQTGVLLEADFDVRDLADAVRQMTTERAAAMREACEARAGLFTRERFASAMRTVVREALDRKAAGNRRTNIGPDFDAQTEAHEGQH